MTQQNGPPGGGGDPRPEAADRTTNTSRSNEAGSRDSSRLRARRATSWRLPVLDSGRSDPWHNDDGPALRGYAAAARHLLGHGLTPAPNRAALRAMWYCGGSDRVAAEIIAERWGLVG